jgi:hypothetical protein
MLPAKIVTANNPASAGKLRFRNTDKSMEDLPFLEGILHDVAGRRSFFQSLQNISARCRDALAVFREIA